jgi:hypothetical protein
VIGAVLNTAQLDDKTWFIVLLVTGVLGLGFFVMIAYLLAGPDDRPTPHRADRPEALPTGRVA